MLLGSSSLKPTYACKKRNIVLSVMESSFIGLVCGSSWPQSMCGFLSMGEVDCFVGAPMRLGTFMSRKLFAAILKALVITARQPPAFSDHFWEVREIIEAWNANMTEQFTPSWVSCLDESMSTWMNKYSCPGWMFVP